MKGEKKVRKAGREEERDCTRRCDQVPWRAPPPPHPLCENLKKKKTTYPPLSDLRPLLPPPFAPSRAQEFPTLPPKPLKVLPKPEEDKKFFEQWRF